MADSISIDQLCNWIRLLAESLQEQRSHLNDLDSDIGDGDHGTNMARGSAAALGKVDADKPEFADDLLKLVGMTLVSSVGGASGPLYGTFFLRFSTAVGHAQELSAEVLSVGLLAGYRGVLERGKAAAGDKTMVDAMLPAIEALPEATSTGFAGLSFAEALRLAATAAAAGRDATEPMVARKGRASYLGERSVGHIDPGAASTAILFETLHEALA